MTGPQISRAAKDLARMFANAGSTPVRWEDHSRPLRSADTMAAIQHCHWMLLELHEFIIEGRDDKAMRWLCFAQGIAWLTGIATLDQMKEQNRAK